MRRPFFHALVALVGLMALVGCTRRFTADLAFKPPSGWIYSAVPGGGEVWIKGAGSKEQIMAQATETPLPSHLPKREGHHDLWQAPGVLMVESIASAEIWEAVSTMWGAERYMAVYVRPISVTPDPNAEAAIRTLCLKR